MENIVNTIDRIHTVKTVDVQGSWSDLRTTVAPLAHGRVRVLAPSMRGRACGGARSFVTESSTVPAVTTIDAFPGTTAWGPPT